MRYYPICLDVKNKKCLVAGGGQVGARKAAALVRCGAEVVVVSPDFSEKLHRMAEKGEVELKSRGYISSDIQGVFLVFGATNDESLNAEIAADADAAGVLCNIADMPDRCNFILPSVINRGDLAITVSTSGKSPALARKLRMELEDLFGQEYSDLLVLMGKIREVLLGEGHEPAAHKRIFRGLLDRGLLELIRAGNPGDIERLVREVALVDLKYTALFNTNGSECL